MVTEKASPIWYLVCQEITSSKKSVLKNTDSSVDEKQVLFIVCCAVCRYTTTVRVSEQKPYQVRAYTWCFNFPPRCSKYKINFKTVYKTVVRFACSSLVVLFYTFTCVLWAWGLNTVNTTLPATSILHELWESCSSVADDASVLGCNALCLSLELTFWRIIALLSSGAWAWRWRC